MLGPRHPLWTLAAAMQLRLRLPFLFPLPTASRFQRSMSNDTRIQDIALQYIRKVVEGGGSRWLSTTLGAMHPSLVGRLSLEDAELILVCGFFSEESWYAFTTRRIVSQFGGILHSIDPSHGIRADFGDFKGRASDRSDPLAMQAAASYAGVIPREVATITASDTRAVIRFEFETGGASMLPIYAARYWVVKHPALDKLMTTTERETYISRNG